MTTDATLLEDAAQLDDNVTAVKARSAVYHPGRNQPYTVWIRGKVWYFCKTPEEAAQRLSAAANGVFL